MKSLFTGTIEIVLMQKNWWSTARGWITVPAEAIEAAGLTPGRVRVAMMPDGKMAITKPVSRPPEIVRMPERVRVGFVPKNLRLRAVATLPRAVPLAASPGRVDILLPEKGGAVSLPRPVHTSEGYMIAAAGLYGAARALALDAGRRSLRIRPLEVEQAMAVLRDAGHRVHQISPRLWSIDGRTASIADLAEAARRVDQEAVLVAD